MISHDRERRRLHPDALTAVIIGAGATTWILSLARYWGARPEYADRFLVLLGAAWAAYKLHATRPLTPDSRRSRPSPRCGIPILLFGCALHALGWMVPEHGSGVLSIWLWLIAVALIIAGAGVLIATRGWAHLRYYAFPLVFGLFALQPPTMLMSMLQGHLQGATTSTSAALLQWLDYDVKRSGYILRLPAGQLGVAEACSGIRSLTALTALAAFIAFVKGFGPIRGLSLVILSVPIVVLANVFRVVASGVIQETFGVQYVQDNWHDALGVGVILFGLSLVLTVARILNFALPPAVASESVPETENGPAIQRTPPSRLPSWLCAGIVLLAMLASIAAVVCRGSSGSRNVEVRPVTTDFSMIPLKIAAWQGKELPIPGEIRDELGADRMLHRSYRNNLGYRIDVWVVVWATPETVKGYHHPDVCLPGRGDVVRKRWYEPVESSSGLISCTARMLAHEVQTGQWEDLMAYYWTQEGSRVWTAEDEWRAVSQVGGLRSLVVWGETELRGQRHQIRDPRLVVILGTPQVDASERKEISDFAGRLADEVYRACPWADLRSK